MSRNILLYLKYDGAAYHGWQLQENADTVQNRVNLAVNGVFHENINVAGCSRTDTGVHAEMFCCNFHTEKPIPCDRIVPAVNSYLPEDIAVYEAREVSPEFHARFSCRKKEYVYRICNTKYPDPFYRRRALFYPFSLDERELNLQAQDFTGTHDFSAFCSSGSAVQNKVRTVYHASFSRTGDLVEFRICADGFLYNMVRICVGTLLSVAEGKIPPDSIPGILRSGQRGSAGPTAPAQGLYLSQVIYETEGM